MRSRCAIFIFGVIGFVFLFNLQAAHSHEAPVDAEEAIRRQFPDLAIDAVEETPIAGLYEITIEDAVLYYHPETGVTLFGEMWSREKKNLTAIRKAAVSSGKIKNLPLDQAIKIGDGPHTVIEVVDPDCPYCRKTHAFFNRRDDLTRYVFLYPLTQLHPEAEAKSLYILCAENREKAYDAVLSGRFDGPPAPPCRDEKAAALLDQHKRIGERLHVRGTPALWIDGRFVSGADFRKITEILDGRP